MRAEFCIFESNAPGLKANFYEPYVDKPISRWLRCWRAASQQLIDSATLADAKLESTLTNENNKKLRSLIADLKSHVKLALPCELTRQNRHVYTHARYTFSWGERIRCYTGYAPPLSVGTVLCTHKRDFATVTRVDVSIEGEGGGGVSDFTDRTSSRHRTKQKSADLCSRLSYGLDTL